VSREDAEAVFDEGPVILKVCSPYVEGGEGVMGERDVRPPGVGVKDRLVTSG